MKEVYLDNSATTKPFEDVVCAMEETLDFLYGNPSSLHTKGFESERLLKKSRKIIANSLGKKESTITFNSGGTEGDNNVLQCVARDRRRVGKTIITTQVEHPAILETCKFLEKEGFNIIKVSVDEYCNPNLDELQSYLSKDVILISAMAVNNEVGTIFPIKKINEIKGDALFHSDAVQAYGKLDMNGFEGDFLTASGHKIHGPKGIGFLYKKSAVRLSPLIYGGNQESGYRSGTENVPGIVGMAKATELIVPNIQENYEKVKMLWRRLKKGVIDIGDVIINSPDNCTPYILNASFMGTRGEVILHRLESKGIFVSTGSACSSNKNSKSHVLKAMGKTDKEIEGAIRFSLSIQNTAEEIDAVLTVLEDAVKKFRKLGSF
ncbi:MAG: cysteine desulfurase family protein [Clostridiales bacterium]|nr:cysteine desulfurase family protein [Clostridiales bacterium]